ncbi:MAG: Rieske 2Fe-2S domain-containing protein [Verrucomicrobia bacterium]|nr:Rieske 2Fe-2S domain-containing protein [Verrucomicrobiota bacterium]
MRRENIAQLRSLQKGQTAKFTFVRDGIKIEGFVANFEGQIVAYENLCRHLPLTLDYADNRFFTADGRRFICQTHGAIYEPLTGRCVEGPCLGASLKPLTVELDNESIWLVTPD